MIVTLEGDIPDTTMSKAAVVTIEGVVYNGTVKAILISETPATPALPMKVTIEAPGLTVIPP